jgi:Fe-S-cluster-containing dehydrogenase component
MWQDGRYPNVKWRFLPLLCNHCDAPSCLPPCPVPGATYKQDDGLVLVDKEKCIGCGKCVAACPYDARYVWEDGKADKCDYCGHLLAQGQTPACVWGCMGKARFIGDINDPNSVVSQLISQNKNRIVVRKPDSNTKPTVYYILDDRKQLEEV